MGWGSLGPYAFTNAPCVGFIQYPCGNRPLLDITRVLYAASPHLPVRSHSVLLIKKMPWGGWPQDESCIPPKPQPRSPEVV